MRTFVRSLSPALCLVSAIGLASSGCILVHDHDPAPSPPGNPNLPGDISFLWSFDGEQRCSRAGVDELDVQVVTLSGELVFGETVPCAGGGLTLTDFAPGNYEVWLDAFTSGNEHLYTGVAAVTVRGGLDNDIGVIELDPVAPPPPATGDLALYWTFLYPTNDSVVTDCATAGVTEVVLEVVPLAGGEGYANTFACDDEGVIVEGLVSGDYTLSMVAYGRYQNMPIALYEKEASLQIGADAVTDLGDVYLERVYESFADIEVTWTLAGGTCAELGVSDVEVSIRRLNGDLEDDHFTVECDRTFALRQTFVPGSYVVEASAMGAAGTYVGAATLGVAPNTTAPADLELVLSN